MSDHVKSREVESPTTNSRDQLICVISGQEITALKVSRKDGCHDGLQTDHGPIHVSQADVYQRILTDAESESGSSLTLGERISALIQMHQSQRARLMDLYQIGDGDYPEITLESEDLTSYLNGNRGRGGMAVGVGQGLRRGYMHKL